MKKNILLIMVVMAIVITLANNVLAQKTLTATITPEGPITFCQGDSVKLDANTGSNYTYKWQSNGLLLMDTTSTFTAKSSGNYTVIVTQNTQSDTSAPILVIVNPLPTSGISGTDTICSGGSANFSVLLTGTPPWTITYTDGTAPVIINGITASPKVITVSPLNTTTYTITAVSDANCTGTSIAGVAVITVNTLPPSPPTQSTIISSQNQIVWKWNRVPGATGYKWNAINYYNSAVDIGTDTSRTDTGLSCSTSYTRYIWAYNSCGSSTATTLTQITTACSPGLTLWGMTERGGVNDYGDGVLFKYDPATNTLTKKLDFDGINTGNRPYGNLMQANNGNLYGMTQSGGSFNLGVIFEYNLNTNTYTKLIDFRYNTGNRPRGSLMQASNGNLYGMTKLGGARNDGVIFSYNINTSTYTQLIDFDWTNGGNPEGSLIQASNGNLYGMTMYGGANEDGVIFQYNPNTSTYTKLIDFDGTNNGSNPHGSLMQASNGKLYGMTLHGGEYNAGVIFEYDTATSTITKTISLSNISNNISTPWGSLMQASNGKLYGMYWGFDGGLFEYDLTTDSINKIGGYDSYGSLMQASDGNLYGMAPYVGANGDGGIFEYDPTSNNFTTKIDFTGTNGSYPTGDLIEVCIKPPAPIAGKNPASENQITWNWKIVAGATGCKWNTINNYNTAFDMGTDTSKTETGLSCDSAYTRYVWAYNACGYSTATSLIQTLAVSVSISESENPVCSGTEVTFTASPTNGGTTPSYKWYITSNQQPATSNQQPATSNQQPATSNQLIYKPSNNDIVTCVLTSSNTCAAGNTATSNPITMTVSNKLAVNVNIEASSNPVCLGTPVTFTATPTNGGTTPSYQWYINSNQQPSISNQLIYVPLNSDVVTCVLTSKNTCATGNPTTSNAIIMTVNNKLPVSIIIEANANQVCSGTFVTFTAKPTNGGTAPKYQWELNGIATGADSSTYIYTSWYNYAVTCVLTSNASCTTGNPATSYPIPITVNSLPYDAEVNIIASSKQVCSGTSVTFTATPSNDVATPSYQWEINSVNTQQSTVNSYTYTPSNNDIIQCLLTSNGCGGYNWNYEYIPAATSNEITMTVNNNLPVRVNVAASADTVLLGTSVTFSASPTNGGTQSSYMWEVNGKQVSEGIDDSIYTYKPLNKDSITCIFWSSASCRTGNPATSNPIRMIVKNTISGYVRYDNADTTGMENTKLYLANNGDTIITTTDITGYYEFKNLINGTYNLWCKTSIAWGGVNPVDALLVDKTYIGINRLTDILKREAADVNNDGKINPVDALLIDKRYIRLIRKFTIPDWLYSSPLTLTIDNNNISKTIKAICAGDVNASYSHPKRVMSYELGVMSNNTININYNKPFDIPVYLSSEFGVQSSELGAIGVKLLITNNELRIISIKSDLEGLIYNISDNEVDIAWAAENEGNSITPDKPLFVVSCSLSDANLAGLQNLRGFTINNSFQITSESELADIDANLISIDKLVIPEIIITNYELRITNYPNPFNNITNINYTIPEDANVELNLYNVLGQKIAAVVANEPQQAGNHSLQYDGSGLRQGVYYLQLRITNYELGLGFYTKTNILMIAR